MKTRLTLAVLIMLIGGCASYSAIGPGAMDYSGLKIATSQAWNLAPPGPAMRSGSKVWTQDGILLDRILFIPEVASGESLFKPLSSEQALPVFKDDMLPNEIEELTESSVVKLFGEDGVVVEATNLRPHRFGDQSGFLFDLAVTLSDGPGYKGVVGAFVFTEKLFLMLYLGAEPYYYEKHLDEALVVIKGAHV